MKKFMIALVCGLMFVSNSSFAGVAAIDENFTTNVPGASYIFNPVVGDLNNDGQMETFVQRTEPLLHGYDSQGNSLPNFPVNLAALAGLPAATLFYDSGFHPAIADLNNDGTSEVIAIVRLAQGGADVSRLFVLNLDGTVYLGWPAAGVYVGDYYTSSATVADLDHDGNKEIIVGSLSISPLDCVVRVLKSDGTSFNASFPRYTNVTINYFFQSTPAVGDLDNDGSEDIVFIQDFKIHAIRSTDGSQLPGWPSPFLWTVRTSVALGDVDGNGELNVVARDDSNQVVVLNPDGSSLTNWPVLITGPGNINLHESPSLADLDGDGKLEIVFLSYKLGDGIFVEIYRADGTPFPGWPQNVSYQAGEHTANVAIADLNGDGELDIAYLSSTGYLFVWDKNGTPFGFNPMGVGPTNRIYASPNITDLQNDGNADIVLSSYSSDLNIAYIRAIDFAGTYSTQNAWTTFNGNNQHTALYSPRYTLTVNIVGEGTVSITPDQPNYAPTQIVQLVATPNPVGGWRLGRWLGDITGAIFPGPNRRTIQLPMNRKRVVSANFFRRMIEPADGLALID